MAVYTDVAAEDLAEFLKGYDIGELLSYKGIAEGVENSNFLLHTSKGAFILTLYEKRVAVDDLPYFLSLMAHLAERGVRCPQPARNRKGEVYSELAGRPAAIINFLEGVWPRRPNAAHCTGVGEALAKMHLAGRDFPMFRKNPLSVEGWRPLFDLAAPRADSVAPGLHDFIARELDHLEACWPKDLPPGVIHADLFPDNVFFLGDKLSGLIDFPFSCNDMLAYDVAICLNAWCFEPDHAFNVTKARALLNAYGRERQLSEAEQEALPLLARGCGAALPADAAGRFSQRAAGRAGEAEGPARICPQAALPPERFERARLRPDPARMRRLSELPHVTVFTDGACSGNPGPGGWGAILRFGDKEKELKGGEAHTTNNRMELMAAISALEALKKPCVVDLTTDSQYVRQGITGWIHGWKKNGWRTSDKKPVKNVDLWQRLDAALKPHQVRWHWIKGHAGHDENERADQLAREGVAMARLKA